MQYVANLSLIDAEGLRGAQEIWEAAQRQLQIDHRELEIRLVLEPAFMLQERRQLGEQAMRGRFHESMALMTFRLLREMDAAARAHNDALDSVIRELERKQERSRAEHAELVRALQTLQARSQEQEQVVERMCAQLNALEELDGLGGEESE